MKNMRHMNRPQWVRIDLEGIREGGFLKWSGV